MRQLLLIILIVVNMAAFGQTTTQTLGGPTTKVLVKGGLQVDSALSIPNDTIMRANWPKDRPALSGKNGKPYWFNPLTQRFEDIGLDIYRRNDSILYKKNGTEISLGTYLTRNTADLVYAAISGSNNYIQNQSAAAQTANAWINGALAIGEGSFPSTYKLQVNGDAYISGRLYFKDIEGTLIKSLVSSANGYIGTSSNTGLFAGNGNYFGYPFSYTNRLTLGFYGATLYNFTANANSTGFGYTQEIGQDSVNRWTNKAARFDVSLRSNNLNKNTNIGFSTTITDSSTAATTLIGLDADVSKGTNTNAVRLAARFMGGPIRLPKLAVAPNLGVENGDKIYNTTTNKEQTYVNGAWQNNATENNVILNGASEQPASYNISGSGTQLSQTLKNGTITTTLSTSANYYGLLVQTNIANGWGRLAIRGSGNSDVTGKNLYFVSAQGIDASINCVGANVPGTSATTKGAFSIQVRQDITPELRNQFVAPDGIAFTDITTAKYNAGVTIYEILTQRLKILNLPTYADDAAAGAAGLTQNTVYKTSTGVLMIKL